MFNIYLNGKKRDIDEGMSISDLLEVNEIKPEIVVVEINDKIIERGKYKDTILIVKDRVEFVYYMGGG
ncbi:MAG: sulfur carrier protein ThiS [Candidatus Omnitrophica bacterium]|nr:sulfur carrier protein ThiS [Candidatus Omnitrophota bacterium]MCK5494268.1 sulfur carrier protein ThiS [Candidatus Omnitrophota bacterium]